MPHTDVIPTSASIASTGLGIRYVGKWAYAYSGKITTTGGGSADTTYLDFTSGSGVIVANLRVVHEGQGGDVRLVTVSFNDTIIIAIKGDDAPDWGNSFPIKLIIPPLTKVEVKCGVSGGAVFTAALTGRVYGET